MDSLGDRIKKNYEDRTRYLLPRRTYTIIRVDGRAFHTYLRDADKPFDHKIMKDIDSTAEALLREIQGSCLAFTQSDEISILATDFKEDTTEAWFDNNLQKVVSVAASIATAEFNKQRMLRLRFDFQEIADALSCRRQATFDARAFTISDPVEVENYFIWRQKDAERNSLQMLARSLYSHNELEGKGTVELHDLIHAKGMNWNDLNNGVKRGRVSFKSTSNPENPPVRTTIITEGAPIFIQDREYLRNLIPILRNNNE